MTFKIGEFIVYKGHGIAEVLRLESKNIFGKLQEMATVELLSNNMKIIFPVDNADQLGIRKILNKDEISKDFRAIKRFKVPLDNNWSSRYRWSMHKLATSEFKSIAEALKCLLYNKTQFDLSFGERKLIDLAKSQLIGELMLAFDLQKDSAEQLLLEKLK